MSFFTVAPAYRGQGLGRAIWVECLQQAKDNGYDGAIHYCVDGNASNAITVGAAKSAGLEARRVFTAGFLMRSLRPGSDEQPEPEAIDAGLFRSAAECLNPGVTLTRLWSEAEAQWHLRNTGRLSIADQTGGVLTGVVQRAADAAHTPCFFLEDVLWDRLTPEARGTLLQRLLRRASRVASIAVAPALGYADVSPFLAAGFRRSPRLLHAYLTLWRAPPDSSEFSGLYLDIV
jgi:hypothetical protein